MTASHTPVPPLRAVTVEVADPDLLLALADPRHPLVALRRGDGIIGLGERHRLTFSGPDRLRAAAEAWRRIAADAVVDDAVDRKSVV